MELWDNAADEYDQFYSSKSCQRENRRISQMLKGDIGRKRIIDIGCGTGFFLDLFPNTPPLKYIGVDPSGPMIVHATQKHPRYIFVQEHIEDLSIVPGQSDLVVCLFSMNYFNPTFDFQQFTSLSHLFAIVYMPHRFEYPTMVPGEEKVLQFWTVEELERMGHAMPWRFDGTYRFPRLNDQLA